MQPCNDMELVVLTTEWLHGLCWYQRLIVNPWRACAARVTVLGLCVCLCVGYSTSHFSRDYSYSTSAADEGRKF